MNFWIILLQKYGYAVGKTNELLYFYCVKFIDFYFPLLLLSTVNDFSHLILGFVQ